MEVDHCLESWALFLRFILKVISISHLFISFYIGLCDFGTRLKIIRTNYIFLTLKITMFFFSFSSYEFSGNHFALRIFCVDDDAL